jgi:flagella basal body P-ring formation protein FlgA
MTHLTQSTLNSWPRFHHAAPDLRRFAACVCGIAVLAAAALPATAQTAGASHPHSDILATVEAAAHSAAHEQGYQDIEVYVRPLDARLRPSLCTDSLEIVRPHAGRVLGPVSYGVRCRGLSPWTLYLRAEVSAGMEVPVLSRALPRATLLGNDDIHMAQKRITTPGNGIITRIEDAVGLELSRPLPEGALLRFGHVNAPRLITRGQTVTLTSGVAGLRVNMQGKAMANAAAGDRLWVTNLSSGRRVEGRVMSDGSVRIE